MDMQGPSCLDIAEDSSIEICSIWIYSLGRLGFKVAVSSFNLL